MSQGDKMDIKKKLPPTRQEQIELGLERNYERANARHFLGAGRRYFQRGSAGYFDNIIPVGGRRVVEAIKKIAESKGRSAHKTVDVLDIGCANGKADFEVVDYCTRKGIDVSATCISGNRREFLENPPTDGAFTRLNDTTYRLEFPLMFDGKALHKEITYLEGDMHRLVREQAPKDVIVSVAAIKYSHDPWRVFSDALRTLNGGGYLFVAHLQRGTNSSRSNTLVYDINGIELTPRAFLDRIQELNPDYTVVCNEDAERRVVNHEGRLVYNNEVFYDGKAMRNYRDGLVKELRGAEKAGDKDRRRRASIELGRVSGHGFLNVSVKKGKEPPYTGLLYAGHGYEKGASYLFVPDRAQFIRLQRDHGYLAV